MRISSSCPPNRPPGRPAPPGHVSQHDQTGQWCWSGSIPAAARSCHGAIRSRRASGPISSITSLRARFTRLFTLADRQAAQGGILMAFAPHDHQDQDFAVMAGKVFDGGHHPLAVDVAVMVGLYRPERRNAVFRTGFLVPPFLDVAVEGVAHDREQPGPQHRPALDRLNARQRLHQRFRHKVIGNVQIPGPDPRTGSKPEGRRFKSCPRNQF